MTKRQIILWVLVALAVRLAYHQLVPFFDGSYNNGSDSGKYIIRALAILEHGEVILNSNGELRADFGRMPLYPHFVAAVFWITGGENLAMVTAVQAAISSLTIVAIGLIAGALNRRWMLPAAVLASFWPAFVVYTAWVLTDSLFIDLFVWGICACVWASKSARPLPLLVAAGLAFGFAVLTRPILMFFPYLLVPVLAYILLAGQGRRWRPALVRALVPAVILLAFLVPRLVATYVEYGSPVVSTQSGNHALELIYPCLRTDPDCDRASIEKRRFELVDAAMAKLTDEERKNPILADNIQRRVAWKLLPEVPLRVFILSVLDSAARSVVQTMLYEVGVQLNQNPQYYSAVRGTTIAERFLGFLAVVLSEPFMFVWAIAQFAVLIALPIQLVGLVGGLRDPVRRPLVVFLVVTAGYFLAVNLSFGSPKYGIPLNPVQIVLLVAGLQALLNWRRSRPKIERSGVGTR